MAALAAAVAGTACEPFTLSLTVDRAVVVDSYRATSNHTSNLVQLTGSVQCTRSQTAHLVPEITETDDAGGQRTYSGSEVTVPCGTESARWSEVSEIWSDHRPFPRPTSPSISSRLILHACTYADDPADEDCVTVSRSIQVRSGTLPRD